MQHKEELILKVSLMFPFFEIDFKDLFELLPIEPVESADIEVVKNRHPAKRCFFSHCTAGTAIDDPLEHAHVLAISRPRELAVLVLAEPVYVENFRQVLDFLAHSHPVIEVLPHIVSGKRQHGHGIASNLTHTAGRSGRHLGTHGGSNKDPVSPIERLKHQWHGAGSATTENDGAQRNAVRIFPILIDARALGSGRSESGIGVRRLAAGVEQGDTVVPDLSLYGLRQLQGRYEDLLQSLVDAAG